MSYQAISGEKPLFISFVVRTNYNPVPYKRTTQRQKFKDKEYAKYRRYKELIVAEFARETGKLPHQVLRKGVKYSVDVVAFYKDKTHGDTDNVAKGVNDAIFSSPLSDKFVCGSYDYRYDVDDPRLHILIQEVWCERF